MLEDIKLVINDFQGFYMRGMDDNIPPEHFRVCHNAVFSPHQISQRAGFTTTYDLNFVPRKIFGGVVGSDHFFLILDSNNHIHRDSGVSIMDLNSSCQDFAALNLYNRIYISPNSSGQGATLDYLWVYTGTGVPRLAGGVAPATSLTCVNNAAVGVVSKGTHQFAVSYVTDTGFITPPSALTAYVAPGTTQVDISTIPLGPAECVGRRILCTKAGETELFFVPGTGIINDNTTTSITLNFADTDLVSSADYLNDIYDRIPSGTQLTFYKGRLVVVGADLSLYGSSDRLVLTSYVQDPETFSKVNGFLAIPSEDNIANPPVAGWILRDTLYISKFPGVYGIQDSGDESPNNWPVSVVDESIGCYPNGVGSYTAQYPSRSTSDFDIILTQQGVYLFDGVFRRPPMTWKIEDFWNKIVQSEITNPLGVNVDFWRMTLTHDVVNKKFYINASLQEVDPTTTLQYFILHGDYATGWDADHIKWSTWSFWYRLSAAVMALHPVDNRYVLRVATFDDPKLWSLDPDATTDEGRVTALDLQTGLLDKERGVVTFFTGLQFRAQGNCWLTLTLTDGVTTYTATQLGIISTVSKDWLRLVNFTSEKARLNIYTGGPIDISRIEVKCKPMFLQRPQL